MRILRRVHDLWCTGQQIAAYVGDLPRRFELAAELSRAQTDLAECRAKLRVAEEWLREIREVVGDYSISDRAMLQEVTELIEAQNARADSRLLKPNDN